MESKAAAGTHGWWVWGGWLAGILVGTVLGLPFHSEARAAGGWSREFAGLNLALGALLGGAGGGFVAGTYAAFRKGGRMGGRYLGVSALVLAALAGVLCGVYFAAPFLLFLLLPVLLLLSPVLWTAIAGWSVRRRP